MVASDLQASAQSESARLVVADGSDQIAISDSQLLFNGDYARSGSDLLISAEFSLPIRVVGYFKHETPADLVSPDGATLTGSVVSKLAGPLYPGQYAQTEENAGPTPIGQVESVSVGASVQRADGTVEPLAPGAKVFQNDVVSTVEGGELSITFVDGTIFSLASNSRMVLDDFVYDPSSTDNGATFDLVEGAFVFIAGNVAGSGGMDINTPVSTLGIRGTTVTVAIETINGTTRVNVALNRDPDGGLGSIVITDLNGNLIATVTSDETAWTISPVDGETQQIPRSAVLDAADDQAILSQAVNAYQTSRQRVESGGEFVEGGTSGDNPPAGPQPPTPPDGQEPNGQPPDGGQQPGNPPPNQSGGIGPQFDGPNDGGGDGDPDGTGGPPPGPGGPNPLPPNAGPSGPPPSGPVQPQSQPPQTDGGSNSGGGTEDLVVTNDAVKVSETANPITGNVLANDTGDALQVTSFNGGASVGTASMIAGFGTLTINGDGSFTFDPFSTMTFGLGDPDEVRTVNYTVADSNNQEATGSLQLTVTGEDSTVVIVEYDFDGEATAKIFSNDGGPAVDVSYVSYFYNYDGFTSGIPVVTPEPLNFAGGATQDLVTITQADLANIDLSDAAQSHLDATLGVTNNSIYLIVGDAQGAIAAPGATWSISDNVTDVIFTSDGIRAFYKIPGFNDPGFSGGSSSSGSGSLS